MNALTDMQIELRSAQGRNLLSARDFPLSVGGQGAAVAVAGVDPGVVMASIGLDEHGLYVEPGFEGARLNAQRLTDRSRLAHGDVLGIGDALVFFLLDGPRPRIEIEEARQDLTAPPILDEAAADEAADEEAGSQSIRRVAYRPVVRTDGAGSARGKSWRWAVAAALALLVGALWLLVTSAPVRVVADPADADVDFVGGWFELAFGERYLLRPGSYELVASREGHETVRQRVEVTREPNQEFRLVLPRLPGHVRFDTGGVSGILEIDGQPLGAAPGEYELVTGEHQLTFKADRYVDLKQEIQVEGGGARQTVELKPVPAFSAVTFESKPAGARVEVDGREVGVTPLTVELDAGTRSVSLVAPGFRRWESSIQVEPDTPQTVGPIELGLPDGKLVVRSKPAGADITVGGRYRGRTPLEIALAPGMQYTIEAAKPGYESARGSARIDAGQRATVELELAPILGEVIVRGEPADAQIFVDGAARGSANQTLKLPSTELKVEIRREGYLPYTTTVTPQPGVERIVEYRLLTPEQAREARMPPVITTKAGGQLRLMPTGTYTMGSDRREPGARANESQRQVTLRRPFYLGVHEVTNAEFRKFQPDHISGVIRNRSLDQDDHPVVNITWEQAAEFCNWLSQQEGLPPAYERQGDYLVPVSPANTGYRLPTEAEWEWGARHQPGSAELRRYHWGQSLPVPRNAGNYGDKASMLVLQTGLQGYEDGFVTTAPVGRFKPTPLGLFDMDGNVSEWVQDYYTMYRELAGGPDVDPTGPAQGELHVIRGASWRTTDVTELRLAWREGFSGKAQHVGFRIARYAE